MSLGRVMRFFGLDDNLSEAQLRAIRVRQQELSALTGDELRTLARRRTGAPDVTETFPLAAVIAGHVLGLQMFDVQLVGALALQRGHIAEMQTAKERRWLLCQLSSGTRSRAGACTC